ncbi:hypothetical protein ACP70R_030049 [Stipagrostis hirtigluma subsp. patula]
MGFYRILPPKERWGGPIQLLVMLHNTYQHSFYHVVIVNYVYLTVVDL